MFDVGRYQVRELTEQEQMRQRGGCGCHSAASRAGRAVGRFLRKMFESSSSRSGGAVFGGP